MNSEGSVEVNNTDGIGTVTFSHSKNNSLPLRMLKEITEGIQVFGKDPNVRVIVLNSRGSVFCAGASFDELLAVDSAEKGKDFFSGFAELITAMIRCPKFIIVPVQGKVVGGGVGLIAAADYALASYSASIKLSELSIGIGPFVIGPVVEYKLGKSNFMGMSIDTEWRDADWAKKNGLYHHMVESAEDLKSATDKLATQLAAYNPETMAELKSIFWQGTNHLDTLLRHRAEISGKLVLSEFTVQALKAFKQK